MIDNELKLTIHLKAIKRRFIERGCNMYEFYPLFCIYYDRNKEDYNLPKQIILDKALDIFLEPEKADS